MVLAASSCQLLSFLAAAAWARMGVLGYEDEAQGTMPEDRRPMRLSWIVLGPRIVVATGPSEERVRRLVELAQRECYVANSLRTEVGVEPEAAFSAPADAPTE